LDFLITDFIRTKRDGLAHSPSDLKSFVSHFLHGDVKDYQVASWLMAVYFQGLSDDELVDWTEVMWKSGRSVEKKNKHALWIDKHSTGGVGDKTSMILVPVVSAVAERLFGKDSVAIPMISGRGLGLTGGTLDKLESVPGFDPHIRMEEAAKLADAQGFFMAGQTSELAPADQRIYALRDVTSTVDSIPLIVSSILSKKLAASVDGLVMDVKVGTGATFHSIEDAKKLANELLRVGRKKGLKMTALITSMDEPLGYTVGHALEMEECEAFLTAGAKRHPGLKEVVVRLAVEMLAMASNGKHSPDELESEIELELEAPEARRRFVQMLECQGGNWAQFTKRNRGAYTVTQVLSPQDGQLAGWDARAVAKLVRTVGGTRITKEQRLDLEVGFRSVKIHGDHVRKGEVLAEVTTQKGFDSSVVKKRTLAAVQWAEPGAAVEARSWVWEILR